MTCNRWMILLGIGLLAPAHLEAQRPGRELEREYARPGAYSEECRVVARRGRNRQARSVCAYDVAPIHVRSGRIAGATSRWVNVDWGLVFIRRTARRDRFEPISQGRLKRMLGHATVSRLRTVGRRTGLRGSLRGHWYVGPRRGAVLVVSMGGRDVAHLADYNRDGLVDDIFLRDRLRAARVSAYR